MTAFPKGVNLLLCSYTVNCLKKRLFEIIGLKLQVRYEQCELHRVPAFSVFLSLNLLFSERIFDADFFHWRNSLMGNLPLCVQ